MTFLKFRLLFPFLLLFTSQGFAQYNFDTYFKEAVKDVNEKNYTDALPKLNLCLQVKPGESAAYFYRGVCKYFLNDYQGAKQDLLDATAHYSPIYYDAYHFLALSKDRLEDFMGAIADFNKILDKYNTDPAMYVERAFSKLSALDYNGAVADCNKAYSMAPMGISEAGENLYLCRGAAENGLNEYEKALRDYDKALTINPKNENIYVRKGLTKHKMNNDTGAVKEYDKALKIDSGCTYAYYNRAESKAQLNDKKGALADYNSLIKYEPNNAAAYFSRAALEADMTNYKAAIADFNKVLQLNPDNIEANFNLAKLKEMVRDFKGALAGYNKCIELFPYFIEAYYDKSELEKRLGNMEASKKDFDTGKMMSEMNHSKSSTQLTHDSLALAHLTALTADFENVNPNQSDTVSIELLPLYYIAVKDSSFKNSSSCRPLLLKASKQQYTSFCLTNKESQAKAGATDSSFAIHSEVKKGNDSEIEALLKKALKKTDMQLFNDAVKDYDKIVALYPASAVAYFARAVNACREVELLNQFDNAPSFMNQKNSAAKTQKNEIFQKALSDFNKTVQLEPDFAVAYYNRAYVKCQLQDFNGAIKDYDNAIHADADLADAYYNRGLFLLYLKDKIDACKDFSKAGERGLPESYTIIKKYCPR